MFRRNGQVKSPWRQSWGEKSPWWDVLIFATGRIAFKPGVRVELWMRIRRTLQVIAENSLQSHFFVASQHNTVVESSIPPIQLR